MSLESGPHHCIGVSTVVSEMVFRLLQSRCAAKGGSLSAQDLEAARDHFLKSFPNASGFFTTSNQRCMEASGVTALSPFDTEAILGTLLQHCGIKAARSAFPHQFERCGEAWSSQFFRGLADFLRQSSPDGSEARLVKAYMEIAVKRGSKLELSDLLQDEQVRAILRERVTPLMAKDAPDVLAAPVSDQVSLSIAAARGIPRPDISKVTDQEVRNFLTWLPPQLAIALAPTPAARQPAA